MYLNKAIIIGNLTRDPEMRTLPSGVSVTSFSLATNRVYKDKDGNKQEQVEFHKSIALKLWLTVYSSVLAQELVLHQRVIVVMINQPLRKMKRQLNIQRRILIQKIFLFN